MKKKTIGRKSFHLEFKNSAQKIAWSAFEQNEILFLLGAPGTGKTHLATAFAINEILSNKKSRIIITRPAVDAGEKLGFLPGDENQKVAPYLEPIFDCVSRLVGYDGPQREIINKRMEISQLAYMKGRTFCDAICILDEAQNATYAQLKMYLTRLGDDSKIIITGDPKQSDLPGQVALLEVVERLKEEIGIGIVEFNHSSIVRHPLVAKILKRLEK